MYNPKNKNFLTVLNTYLFDDRRKEKRSESKPTSNRFYFFNLAVILVILYLILKNIYK